MQSAILNMDSFYFYLTIQLKMIAIVILIKLGVQVFDDNFFYLI